MEEQVKEDVVDTRAEEDATEEAQQHATHSAAAAVVKDLSSKHSKLPAPKQAIKAPAKATSQPPTLLIFSNIWIPELKI